MIGQENIATKALSAIVSAGEAGATCDDIVRQLGVSKNTVGGRVSELRKHGLVFDTGRRRRTSNGSARVYIAASIFAVLESNGEAQ